MKIERFDIIGFRDKSIVNNICNFSDMWSNNNTNIEETKSWSN